MVCHDMAELPPPKNRLFASRLTTGNSLSLFSGPDPCQGAVCELLAAQGQKSPGAWSKSKRGTAELAAS